MNTEIVEVPSKELLTFEGETEDFLRMLDRGTMSRQSMMERVRWAMTAGEFETRHKGFVDDAAGINIYSHFYPSKEGPLNFKNAWYRICTNAINYGDGSIVATGISAFGSQGAVSGLIVGVRTGRGFNYAEILGNELELYNGRMRHSFDRFESPAEPSEAAVRARDSLAKGTVRGDGTSWGLGKSYLQGKKHGFDLKFSPTGDTVYLMKRTEPKA